MGVRGSINSPLIGAPTKKREELEREKIELEKMRISADDKDAQREHDLELARLQKDIKAMEIIAGQTALATETVEETQNFMKAHGINTDTFEERAENALKPVLEAASKAGSAEFGGVVIEAENADTLKTPYKNEKAQIQLNGRYRVQIVNTKEIGVFKVQLFNEETKQELWANVQDENNQGNKKVIQKAEWSKKPLHLAINATQKAGKIIDATVINAEWIGDPPES